MRESPAEAPRRKVGLGGCWTRRAQSSVEWPGSRSTFLEGRRGVGRVDVESMEGWRVVGRRVEVGRDMGGWRSVLDGRAELEGEEGAFRRGCIEVGRGRNDDDGKRGGGIRVLALGVALLGCRFASEAGRAGGGIDKPVCKSDARGCEGGDGDCSDGDCSDCDPNSSLFGGVFFDPTSCKIPPALCPSSSDVRAKDGSGEAP